MTRESSVTINRIALLATGDEIVNGDILNSNAQVIAQKLFRNGIHAGLHMTATDNINEIEQCINYLLSKHRCIIMTGGLGPTSDDLTRYALSKALDRPLMMNPDVWNDICERFRVLGYKGEPPEGNQQQALFPEGAVIISNPNGTAAGCYIVHDDKLIFMLPGPPFECLPMVDKVVLPMLKKADFQEILFYESWLLFGIGESLIADQLDAIAKPFDCVTGYRIAFPYIEFKLSSSNERDFRALVSQVKKTIAPYLLLDGKQPASQALLTKLENIESVLKIRDSATGGLLESILKTPVTFSHVEFEENHADVEITGLEAYWQMQDHETTELTIHFANGNTSKKSIPLRGRGQRVKQYAVEFICEQIYLFLK